MEAFSLLKYWRGSSTTVPTTVSTGATTIVTAVSSSDEENDENGPFFDLEFSVPAETGSTGSTGSEGSCPVSPLEEPVIQAGSEPEPGINSKPNLAANFRVLMLKLKKKSDNEKENDGKTAKPDMGSKNKFFIKFRIEEVPIKSVFKRENSSKSSNGTKHKVEKAQCEGNGAKDKRFSTDAMQRYLKMVSKRYGERMRFNGEGEAGLEKSRSVEGGRRRDDSLVQQEDGIQSAILHCKRSFNSTHTDADMSILSRSISDPSHDYHKSLNTLKKCSEEFKENGI